MNRNIKVAVAQMNSYVGGVEYNYKKIVKFIKSAKERAADLICFPELALVGYPPEDLLLSSKFLKSVELAIKKIQQSKYKTSFILGYPKIYGIRMVFIIIYLILNLLTY